MILLEVSYIKFMLGDARGQFDAITRTPTMTLTPTYYSNPQINLYYDADASNWEHYCMHTQEYKMGS
jgi:hypothetical protein